MSAAPRMAFSGVWPTLLIVRRLQGFEQPTAALLEHIAAIEAREADHTARYQEQQFFAGSHPGVRWLTEQINQTTAGFLQHLGVKRSPKWTIFGWYNVNRYGDHHAAHSHPRCNLSGTYYAKMPAPPAKLDDPHSQPACISFYDPRAGANMVTAGAESDARASYAVRPEPGTLMMWPSPLQHAVHPNLSSEDRVTISFNVTIDAPG